MGSNEIVWLRTMTVTALLIAAIAITRCSCIEDRIGKIEKQMQKEAQS